MLVASISRSLRAKVTLGVVLPLVLILGVFTAAEYARHRAATLANLSFVAAQTGEVIENSLQHDMLSRNPVGIQQMLDGIAQDEKIRAVYLLDTTGRVVFAPGAADVGQTLNNQDPTCQPCHRLPAEARPKSVVVTLPTGQRVFRSMNPIENREECHACHDPAQHLNGLLLTDIWVAPWEAQLAADLRENIVWWAGTILVTVAVVNLAMSRLVLRRLQRVVQGLTRFGRGQLDLRLPPEGPDEIGRLASAFNEMGQRIQSDEADNRALSEELRGEAARRQELLKRLISAQEEERRRVARDLHDDLGQDLAGLGMGLEAVERMLADSPAQVLAQLERMRGLVDETTQRAYSIILDLRPSDLDDLGLAAALRAHANRVLKDKGIRFELDTRDLSRRLPPEIETALFRAFQEALSNIVRHAAASRVRVRLAACDGTFEGEITDNGRGFDLPSALGDANGHSSRGLGLLGMQERAAHAGGTVEFVSQPGIGTCVRIRVPLPAEADG